MKYVYVFILIMLHTSVFADIVSDFSNMCGENSLFNAVFEPVAIDNSIVNAESEFTCAANTARVFNAVFELMVYNCDAGYYLPANIDGCTICPQNYACPGGEYTFNENINQGIMSCESYFSPIGSGVCYPHILHVGDDNLYLKTTKLTTPSLNLKIGDQIFYANMTKSDVSINSETERRLKINYNGNVYSVCDDTITDFEMP